MTPKRIQLRRTKGWRKAENTIVVTRATCWGNPFVVEKDGTRAECMARYEAMLLGRRFKTPLAGPPRHKLSVSEVREALRGKNLACFCRLCPLHAEGKPLGVECPDCEECHSDVLLRWANT